eukprot:GILJ01013252.1.p1 GENE.GILJ01013252.1~~GILJ01013252.1.p1  ORF type:complete len:574 (-),score=64.89 GILJ01013252.1:195-1916(-)
MDDVNAFTDDQLGYTALHFSVQKGHQSIAKLLLDYGADINACTKKRETVLHLLCENEEVDLSFMQFLLQYGEAALINECNQDGKAVLHIAAGKNNIKLVELLLNFGADIHLTTEPYKHTPLYSALESGHSEMAHLLLQRGADAQASTEPLLYHACNHAVIDESLVRILFERGHGTVNTTDTYGVSAVHLLAMKGHVELLTLLLDNGADIHETSTGPDYGYTALHFACRASHVPMIRLLLERGADIHGRANGKTPLFLCHDATVAELLLDHGADINARTKTGKTILHHLCLPDFQHYYDIDMSVVRLLLKRGASEHIKEPVGEWDATPLHYAAMNHNRYELMELLLDSGADIHAAKKGRTVLHVACSTKDKEVPSVRLLLERGASIYINTPDDKGNTPLFAAISASNLDLVRFLLENGADVNLLLEEGTALHKSVSQSPCSREMVELLLDHGADVILVADKGPTVLSLACSNAGGDKCAVVRLLLERGAKVHINMETPDGDTLLRKAVSRKDRDLAMLLLDYGADFRAVYKSPTLLHDVCTRIEIAGEMTRLLTERRAAAKQLETTNGKAHRRS